MHACISKNRTTFHAKMSILSQNSSGLEISVFSKIFKFNCDIWGFGLFTRSAEGSLIPTHCNESLWWRIDNEKSEISDTAGSLQYKLKLIFSSNHCS